MFVQRFGGFILAPVVLSVSVRKGACTTFSRIRRCHELKSRLTKGIKFYVENCFFCFLRLRLREPNYGLAIFKGKQTLQI